MILALCALACPFGANALDYPTRPVRFVVGYPAGGATDILARLVGQRLSERFGQQFVIENKPGAGNNIGTETVVKAEADGYTVLLINPANFINASLYTNLNFNFIRDIAPVASFIRVPNVMTVAKEVPAKTVAEFIAYVKANPGKVTLPRPATAPRCICPGRCSCRCRARKCCMCLTGAQHPRSPTCSATAFRSSSTTCPRSSGTSGAARCVRSR
jgi:tripartite-type tricarboxylate transporter receptor subunit TctC